MSDCLYVRERAELAERRIVDVEACSQEDRLYSRVSRVEMLTKAVMVLMEEPSSLSSGIMDQYDRVTSTEYSYYEQSHFNYQKLVLQTLFGEYEAARETALEMINLMKTYKDALVDPLANCYLSLALLALFGQGSKGEKEEILTQVHDNQDTLEKLARCAPPNYRHKHHLVEAERMRVLEDQSDAILSHYDQAIALAKGERIYPRGSPGQ